MDTRSPSCAVLGTSLHFHGVACYRVGDCVAFQQQTTWYGSLHVGHSHCADAGAPGWETYSAATTDYGFMHYVYVSAFNFARCPDSTNEFSDIPSHHRGHGTRSVGRVDRYRDQENAAIYRSGQRGFTTAKESFTRLHTNKVSAICILLMISTI